MKNKNHRWLVVAISCMCFINPVFHTPVHAASISVAGPISLTYVNAGSAEVTTYFSTIQAAIDAGVPLLGATHLTVHVPPGHYDEQITMKSNIDLQGAGSANTEISCTCGGASLGATAATLTGAQDSDLRDIAVNNFGGGDYSIGVYNDSAGFKLHNTNIYSTGGVVENRAVHHQSGGPMQILQIKNSEIISAGNVDNAGVFATGGGAFVEINNSKILTLTGNRYSYGVRISNNGDVKIWNSDIDVATGGTDAYGISNSGHVEVYYSKIAATGGSLNSVAIVNGSSASVWYSVLTGAEYAIFHNTVLDSNYAYNQLSATSSKYTNSSSYGGTGLHFRCIGNYDATMAPTGC